MPNADFFIWLASIFPTNTYNHPVVYYSWLTVYSVGPALYPRLVLTGTLGHSAGFGLRKAIFTHSVGGGHRVVVSTAAFHARVQGSVPGLGGLKETKNVSSPSTCESQYCGEPP